MDKSAFRIELERYIYDNVDIYEEYHNKYFLKKKIKELLPEKDDDFIYGAIEFANKNIKSKKRKRDYINSLIKKILEIK